MSEPFRIVLSFNAPIRLKVGSLMVVDVEVMGLDPDADRDWELINGLAYVLASHVRHYVAGPPDQIKQAFLNFMAGVWDAAPVALPVELTSREVADA